METRECWLVVSPVFGLLAWSVRRRGRASGGKEKRKRNKGKARKEQFAKCSGGTQGGKNNAKCKVRVDGVKKKHKFNKEIVFIWYLIMSCSVFEQVLEIITLSTEAIRLHIIYMFIDYRNNSILAKTLLARSSLCKFCHIQADFFLLVHYNLCSFRRCSVTFLFHG